MVSLVCKNEPNSTPYEQSSPNWADRDSSGSVRISNRKHMSLHTPQGRSTGDQNVLDRIRGQIHAPQCVSEQSRKPDPNP